jgi:hypothetical protein
LPSAQATIPAWASIVAKWRISACKLPRKKRLPVARRATDAQVLEDAERLIAAWNEWQARRMPMLFSQRSLQGNLRFDCGGGTVSFN